MTFQVGEVPAETPRRVLSPKNQAIEDFAHLHPGEWFLAYEGWTNSGPSGRFSRASYERRYRSKIVDGMRWHMMYLRYIGHAE